MTEAFLLNVYIATYKYSYTYIFIIIISNVAIILFIVCFTFVVL